MSLLAASLFATALVAPKAEAPHIAYQKIRHGRASYHFVLADLTSGFVSAKTVHTDGLTSPWHLIQDAQPSVAITGTFFAPQDGTPVADVLVDGQLVARGNRGSALGVDDQGNVHIWDQAFLRRVDWSGYRFGLRGGVRLIKNGRVCPNPRAQAFRDPRIWGRAARTGVGVTKHGKLVVMATMSNVTLSEFGRAMKSRGAVDALSLDGGGSTCLYVKGRMVVSTGRRLSNMFVVSESSVAAN
jgi:exopolysaccharide biosynthesis protein